MMNFRCFCLPLPIWVSAHSRSVPGYPWLVTALLTGFTWFVPGGNAVAQGSTGRKVIYLLPEAGAGYGYNSAADKRGIGYHGALAALLKASPTRYYGLQVGYLSLHTNTANRQDYVSAGIVLMMDMTPRIQGTIGTIGYIGVSGEALNNPFGLTTRLQYRPLRQLPVYVGIRSDFLFSQQNYTSYNGLTISLTL